MMAIPSSSSWTPSIRRVTCVTRSACAGRQQAKTASKAVVATSIFMAFPFPMGARRLLQLDLSTKVYEE
jgi:hypothetical protein